MNDALSNSSSLGYLEKQRGGIWQFLAYLVALSLMTWAVRLSNPECTDPQLKQYINLSLWWLPWLICGIFIGYLNPRKCMFWGPLFFLLAYPIVIYVWFASPLLLHFKIGPFARSFTDWERYFIVLLLWRPILVVGLLTLAGCLSGRLFCNPRTRRQALFIIIASVAAFYGYAFSIYSLK